MACDRGFRPTLYARDVHVETVGSGPRVVLVHGSVGSGWSTWWAQRPLAERFTLVVPDGPGSPPTPPVERVDFEEQAPLVADLLEDGAHLVGHSYGGVVSLYAAALRSEAVRSLTVIEPPAFGIARDHPAVDRRRPARAEGGRAADDDLRPPGVPLHGARRGRLPLLLRQRQAASLRRPLLGGARCRRARAARSCR